VSARWGGLTDPCPSITATASSVNRGATPKGPEFPMAHSDSKSTGPGWSNGGTISPSASEKGWVFGVLDDKISPAMDRKTSGKAQPDPHANQQPQLQFSLGGGREGEKRTDQSERGNQLDGGGRGTRSGCPSSHGYRLSVSYWVEARQCVRDLHQQRQGHQNVRR
jgi:hypothetical protein